MVSTRALAWGSELYQAANVKWRLHARDLKLKVKYFELWGDTVHQWREDKEDSQLGPWRHFLEKFSPSVHPQVAESEGVNIVWSFSHKIDGKDDGVV
jgi:hypothetical protein